MSTEALAYSFFDSPLGKIHLGARDTGICNLSFEKNEIKTIQNSTVKKQDAAMTLLNLSKKALEAYFEGRSSKLHNIPLSLNGTEFQLEVWSQLKKIPAGKTLSYGDLAEKLDRPKAYRAVASACAKNPVCLAVPCHRVIASSGKLAGFRGGLERKKKLLQFEGSI